MDANNWIRFSSYADYKGLLHNTMGDVAAYFGFADIEAYLQALEREGPRIFDRVRGNYGDETTQDEWAGV